MYAKLPKIRNLLRQLQYDKETVSDMHGFYVILIRFLCISTVPSNPNDFTSQAGFCGIHMQTLQSTLVDIKQYLQVPQAVKYQLSDRSGLAN